MAVVSPGEHFAQAAATAATGQAITTPQSTTSKTGAAKQALFPRTSSVALRTIPSPVAIWTECVWPWLVNAHMREVPPRNPALSGRAGEMTGQIHDIVTTPHCH